MSCWIIPQKFAECTAYALGIGIICKPTVGPAHQGVCRANQLGTVTYGIRKAEGGKLGRHGHGETNKL